MAEQGYKLYKQIVDITEDYLGPAAKRFIDRQIMAHVGKDPLDLTGKDLTKLTGWIEAAVSLLTDDIEMVDEYTTRLNGLALKSKK